MKSKVVAWEHKFGRPVVAISGICTAVILFDIVILVIDIIMRYVFNHSIPGVKELVELLMCYIAYLGIAYACMEETHIEMTALTDRLSPSKRQVNRVIVYVIMAFYFLLLTAITWRVFYSACVSKETLRASVTIYTAIGKIAMPVGSAAAAIQSLFMVIGAIVRVHNPQQSEQNTESQRDGNS